MDFKIFKSNDYLITTLVQHILDTIFKSFKIKQKLLMLILLSDGAPARIRTADLLITNQLLYQLSYKGIRINEVFNVKSQINQHLKDLVVKR